jgi:heme exporter protein D
VTQAAASRQGWRVSPGGFFVSARNERLTTISPLVWFQYGFSTRPLIGLIERHVYRNQAILRTLEDEIGVERRPGEGTECEE